MIDFNTSLTGPLAGMERAESSVNQTAAEIAQSSSAVPGDSVDLSSDMVSMMQAQNVFKADTKAIQVEDDMTKSLLSITA